MRNPPSYPTMASEAYRLSSRMRFLMREIEVMEAQLEHRRDDLRSVTLRMEALLLSTAEERNHEPPSTPSSTPRPRSGKEVPDHTGGDIKIGDRVLITVKGEFKGRKGKVDRPHGKGKHYVYVLLDPLNEDDPPKETIKAPASLQRLRWVDDA